MTTKDFAVDSHERTLEYLAPFIEITIEVVGIYKGNFKWKCVEHSRQLT